MAQVEIHGRYSLFVSTDVCDVSIALYPEDYAKFVINDKRLNEKFVITADLRYKNSLNKVNEILNNGVKDSDIEYLRLLREIKRPQTRAEYFEKFASGQLKLEELQRAVKLSTSKKFSSSYVEEMRKLFCKESHLIGRIKKYWEIFEIYFRKAGELQFVLLLHEYYGLHHALVIGEFGVVHLDCEDDLRRANEYVEYAIYNYILHGKRENLDKWLKEGSEDPSKFLNTLNTLEEKGRVEIYNRDLYNSVKSLVTLAVI
jgi:hypothetical protein